MQHQKNGEKQHRCKGLIVKIRLNISDEQRSECSRAAAGGAGDPRQKKDRAGYVKGIKQIKKPEQQRKDRDVNFQKAPHSDQSSIMISLKFLSFALFCIENQSMIVRMPQHP